MLVTRCIADLEHLKINYCIPIGCDYSLSYYTLEIKRIHCDYKGRQAFHEEQSVVVAVTK